MILKKSKGFTKTFVLVSFLAAAISCSTDDDEDSDASSDDGEVDTVEELEAENPLTAAYPSALALSVFPNETTTTLALQDAGTTSKEKPPEEKIEARQEILQGGADSECFATGLFNDRSKETVTCYEFDNDMNPFNNGPSGSGGTTDGKHSDGEACMVAFARQEVLDATQLVDRALDTVAGILCSVKKAGGDTELPADGETKDFLASVEDADLGFEVATMENLGDGLYKTEISAAPGGKAFNMTLVYKKGETEGESSGVISFKERPSTTTTKLQEGGNDPNNTANMNKYVSVKFAQEYDTDSNLRNRFEVRIASIEKTLDGLDSQGIVDYDVIPDSGENSTSNNFKYVQFDIDAETAEGNISYWRNPGGRLNEPARGFVFNITADDTTGVLSGCGTSGAANVSIRGTLASDGEGSGELLPKRYWHPFAGNNTSADKDDRYTGNGEGPLVTAQCFTQNTSTGIYDIDYDATKALSTSTVDSEVDTHGYDVVPQADGNAQVLPPTPPSAVPTGDFKPRDET
ncbi:hypothetical protein [Pseudobacteriovorax antillogorgiicola]|uniref:Lipoprotein n=1 Tax=Pseudobacteriovorax antillogorgiicola TaxID=1513793 RepID=A0A1Y6BCG7_9BACT|nr:hypothetical protein [Pseudobacteriovorax antillogorgiicola]TCS57461.1 hypothetical protein EDD56_103201 [Pseudobacteriovorax antillogorgiicola]SMF00772.1 hypothetical protein SAMN06296036_103132 [Pseudobacteriovorax antillogorgiicola]